MPQKLTIDTCTRLRDPANNRILLDEPVVRISDIRELDSSHSSPDRNFGLELKYHAVIKDDSNSPSIAIVLPRDSFVNPQCSCWNPSTPAMLDGSTVKLLHMLRVKLDENEIKIYVHRLQVLCQHANWTLADQLESERVKREHAENKANTAFNNFVNAILPHVDGNEALAQLIAEFQLRMESLKDQATNI